MQCNSYIHKRALILVLVSAASPDFPTLLLARCRRSTYSATVAIYTYTYDFFDVLMANGLYLPLTLPASTSDNER